MEIITRKEATEKGLKYYFTGKPCKHGHLCKRYTIGGQCSSCNKKHFRLWRIENKEKHYEISKKWKKKNYDLIKESQMEMSKRWQKKQIKEMSYYYLKSKTFNHFGIVTDELIELKRTQIKIHRYLKENKDV